MTFFFFGSWRTKKKNLFRLVVKEKKKRDATRIPNYLKQYKRHKISNKGTQQGGICATFCPPKHLPLTLIMDKNLVLCLDSREPPQNGNMDEYLNKESANFIITIST